MPIYPYSFQLPPLNVQDIPNNGVPGEFLGINGSGQLDWLTAGGGGSGDMLKSENLSGLASYPTARTNLGLGTGDSPTFANLTLTSPSLGSSAPVTISQTWNAGSNVMTALKVEVTDTASATTSNLLSLDMSTNTVLGAKWRFKFEKSGTLWTIGNIQVGAGLASAAAVILGVGTYTFGGGNGINMIGGVTGYILQHGATQLWRGSADHILEQRNSSNPQTFNVYGTYSTSPSLAYARLAIACDTSGNATLTTQSTGVAGTVSINGVPVGLGKGNISTNISIGAGILSNNVSGSNNIGIGNFTLNQVVSSTNNTAIGLSALQFAQLSNNIGIGHAAGAYRSIGGNNFAQNNNIYIGANTTSGESGGGSNEMVFGASATGIGSNSVVLGNDTIDKTALKGNVGIGTTLPSSKLHVAGELGSNTTTYDTAAGIRLTNTTSNNSWIISSGAIGASNSRFCIRETGAADPSLIISGTSIGLGTVSPTARLHVAGTIKPEQATMVDKAAGFTLAAVDAGTVINSTSATAITINLPAADTAAGYNVMIIQSGAGAVTIAANGNTLNSFGNALITAGQHAACSIVRTAASTYNLSGNLV